MRTILLTFGILAAALMLDARPSEAYIAYPWCHQQGGRDGNLNCSYVSYEQCAVNIPGDGGWCSQNPWYQPGANQPEGSRKPRRNPGY